MTAVKSALQEQLNEYIEELYRPLGVATARALQLAAELETLRRSAPTEHQAMLFGLIGRAWTMVGDADHALSAYRNAVTWASSLSEPHNNLAATYLAMGRLDDALRHAQKARNLAYEDNLSDRAYATLTESLIRFARGEAMQGRQLLELAAHLARKSAPGMSRDRVTFLLACNSAELGFEHDAVEFLARYLEIAHGAERNPDEPAVQVIARHKDAVAPMLEVHADLRAAVEKVTAEWDAPLDQELEFRTRITLDDEAWESFCHAAGPFGPDA